MYWNWEKFTAKIRTQHGYTMQKGFSGALIVMTREGLRKVGYWDEQILAADFDLFTRCKQRHDEVRDLQPLSIIAGVYIHHYGRLSSNWGSKKIPFADASKFIAFEEKWGNTTYCEIINDIAQ